MAQKSERNNTRKQFIQFAWKKFYCVLCCYVCRTMYIYSALFNFVVYYKHREKKPKEISFDQFIEEEGKFVVAIFIK